MSVEPSEEDLATAAMPITIYAALAGICTFFVLVITGISWFQDGYALYMWVMVAVMLLPALILSLLAWGIRKRKTWAWLPAAGFSLCFATMFPIGTIIAYYSLTALWKCREAFFPFKGRQVVPPPLTSTESE